MSMRHIRSAFAKTRLCANAFTARAIALLASSVCFICVMSHTCRKLKGLSTQK